MKKWFVSVVIILIVEVISASALASSSITYDSATKTATLSSVNLTQPSTMITDDLSNAYVSYYENKYLHCNCYEDFGISTGGKFTAPFGTGIYNNNYSYKHQPYLASSTGNFYNGVFFTGIASKPDTYIGFDPEAKPITNLQNPYPASFCLVCHYNSTDWNNIWDIPYDVAYSYSVMYSNITDVLVPHDTTVYYATGTQTVATAVLKNCSTTGRAIALKPVVSSTKSVDPVGFVPSLTGDLATEVVIDGGTYSGSPAVSGSNITVKRGTFTDRRTLYMEARVCIVLLAIFLIFILLRLLSNKIDSLNPGFLEFTVPLETTEFFKANKKPKVVKPWASQLGRYRHHNPVRYSRPSQFDHRPLPRPP